MVTSTALSRYCVCAAAPRTFVISRGSEGCDCPTDQPLLALGIGDGFTDRCHMWPDL